MSAQTDEIAANLSGVDTEIVSAFVEASRSARFCCDVLLYVDSYMRGVSSASAKIRDGKVPTQHRYAWAQKRVRELLVEAGGVEKQLASQLDRDRNRFDGGVPTLRPKGVPGRPTTITSRQLVDIRLLRASGTSVTRMANSGVMPVGTFWGALKRGKSALTGVDRELYLAVYGEDGSE